MYDDIDFTDDDDKQPTTLEEIESEAIADEAAELRAREGPFNSAYFRRMASELSEEDEESVRIVETMRQEIEETGFYTYTSPDDEKLDLFLAETLHMSPMGRWPQNKLREIPHDYEAHYKLAVVHHKAGEFESAIREYCIASGDPNRSDGYMNAIWRCHNKLPYCGKDEGCILCTNAKKERQRFCFGCKTHHDNPCQPEWLEGWIQEWGPL